MSKMEKSKVIGYFCRYKNQYYGLNTEKDTLTSIYENFSNQGEVKESKSLGHMLSHRFDAVKAILEMPKIKQHIRRQVEKHYGSLSDELLEDILKPTSYYVYVEQTSSGSSRLRRDISIQLVKNGIPMLELVIETKKINKVTLNSKEISKKLSKYTDTSLYPLNHSVPVVAIVLSSKRHIFLEDDFIGISYPDLLQVFEHLLMNVENKGSDLDLLFEYIKFVYIQGGHRAAYPVVVSHSSESTSDLSHKYRIFAMPYTKQYNALPTEYVTLRERGHGRMSRIYRCEEELVLDPKQEGSLESIKNENYYDRIKEYIEARSESFGFAKNPIYRFMILDEGETLEIAKNPPLKLYEDGISKSGNYQGFRYYALQDLRGDSEYITHIASSDVLNMIK